MHVNTHDTTYENAYDDDDNSYDFTRFGFQVQAKLDDDQRWSTWSSVEKGAHGPEPRPDWVITEDGAVDTDLGILKTGKEGDVFLLERAVPDDPNRRSVLAAKRYRDNDHRQFHRDSGYVEGRRIRKSREARAAAKGTAFGRAVQAVEWANHEFAALSTLWSAGVPVPYPVQIDGTEI
jgi:RIO kinase 1